MRIYEAVRLVSEPMLSVLNTRVRHDLKDLIGASAEKQFELLDVGARSSPYTIGLPASVTLLDVMREGEIMEQLKLGYTTDQLAKLSRRRSNIVKTIVEDMTRCTIPSCTYDGVVCVEVIEHVEEDAKFVEQVARVLRPGGFAYFTTPNGDYIPNENPDHVRHYRRIDLLNLLRRFFREVEVVYGIRTGRFRRKGLAGVSLRRPIRTAEIAASNLVNQIQSRNLSGRPRGTAHLLATAQNPI